MGPKSDFDGQSLSQSLLKLSARLAPHLVPNPELCCRANLFICRYETLVAGGGDGTLNELVVALLKHNAPQHISVAQLPLGTANDLASATGISLVSTIADFAVQQTFGVNGVPAQHTPNPDPLSTGCRADIA